MAELPLAGVRVIDLGIVLAGPFASMMLGDLGADVIRVESTTYFAPLTRGSSAARPTAEEVREIPAISGGYPGREPGERPWNRFPWFNTVARNRRGITMDLTDPRGVELFGRLVSLSDVLVTNQAPGVATRLGFDYERLRAINPGLVYVKASLFGSGGPFSTWRGTGPYMEAFSGHDAMRHYPWSDVSSNTTAVPSDAAGGVAIALAALIGLFQRESTGEGQLIDIAMIENELALLGPLILESAFAGVAPPARGNRSEAALQGCYQCAGYDHWLTLTVPDERGWIGLSKVLGRLDLAELPYGPQLWRNRHDEIDDAIAAWTKTQDRDAAVIALIESGVWSGPVLPDNEIVEDPQLVARHHFMELDQKDSGRYRYPGPPYKLRESAPFPTAPPVMLGEHNDEIYMQLLGVDRDEVDDLRAAGKIGDSYADSIR